MTRLQSQLPHSNDKGFKLLNHSRELSHGRLAQQHMNDLVGDPNFVSEMKF